LLAAGRHSHMETTGRKATGRLDASHEGKTPGGGRGRTGRLASIEVPRGAAVAYVACTSTFIQWHERARWHTSRALPPGLPSICLAAVGPSRACAYRRLAQI
jgi:hypothetical protein